MNVGADSMESNHIKFYKNGSYEIVDGVGNPAFPFHSHQSFIIGIIKTGKVILKTTGNQYVLADNTAYIIPPNIGFSLTPLMPYSYRTLCISGEPRESLLKDISGISVVTDIGEGIYKLCDSYKSGLQADVFLSELKGLLLVNLSGGQNSRIIKTADFIQNAVNYIDEYIEEKLTLQAIAEDVHISQYYLSRSFKQQVGVTLQQYILQGKLRRARQKAVYKTPSAQIAAQVNFAAQSHLCSSFKKYMGITLEDYKRNLLIK